MFLKKIPIYIKIFVNEVEVTNLITGETVRRQAEQPFSIKRFVIADFFLAEETLRKAMHGLSTYRRFPMRAYKAVVQQMVELEGGLTQIELRALRDLAEQCGCGWVKLVMHARPLSREEAMAELNERN